MVPGSPIPRRSYPVELGPGWRPNPFDFTERLALRSGRPSSTAIELDRDDWPAPCDPALFDPFGFLALADPIGAELDADDSEYELDRADSDAAGRAFEAELRLDWPEPIASRFVARTRIRHSCDRCHGDIEPTEPARVDTIRDERGRIARVYICDECQHPTPGGTTNADRNGCKLWEESGNARGESYELGYFGSSR
ncbi:MAG: hypothetical protein V3T07_09010 [Myxococcota bacterium]